MMKDGQYCHNGIPETGNDGHPCMTFTYEGNDFSIERKRLVTNIYLLRDGKSLAIYPLTKDNKGPWTDDMGKIVSAGMNHLSGDDKSESFKKSYMEKH